MSNEQNIINFLEFRRVTNRSRKDKISEQSLFKYKEELLRLSSHINKPFKKATEKDILSVVKGKSQRTINFRLTVYRSFYRWIYNLSDNETLPDCVKRLKPRKVKIDHIKYRQRVLSDTEYQKLIDYSNKAQHKAIIETIRIAGGRSKEVRMLNIEDVIFDGKRTKITIKESKSEPRDYIYDGRAEHLLLWIEELHPYKNYKNKPLFLTTYSTPTPIRIGKSYISDLLKRTVSRIRINYPDFRHITPHDFRHTNITKLIDEDINPKYVAQQHGITLKQLESYMHNDSKDYEQYLDHRSKEYKPTYIQLERQKQILEKQHKDDIKVINQKLEILMEFMKTTTGVWKTKDMNKQIDKIIAKLKEYKLEDWDPTK